MNRGGRHSGGLRDGRSGGLRGGRNGDQGSASNPWV